MPKRIRVRRIPAGLLHVVVTLTNKHVKSQIVSKEHGLVVLSASTLEKVIAGRFYGPEAERPADWKPTYATGGVEAAKIVGDCLGHRAHRIGITEVLWEAPGSYHGKIKAFIDAFRETGIKLR